MAIEVIKTVKPSGGDYTSLSAWEAGEQKDLVAADEIAVAECYSMLDTSRVTIGGWTTGGNNYVKVYTPASERHGGLWAESKYILDFSPSGSYTSGIKIEGVQHTRIEGVQVRVTTNLYTGCRGIEIFSLGCKISHNIVKGVLSVITGGNGILGQEAGMTINVWNNIVYDFNMSGCVGIKADTRNGSGFYSNNTVNNCERGFFSNWSSVLNVFKNNMAQNCVNGYEGNYHSTSSNNCSDITGDAPGLNPVTGNVTFVDEGADDFHLDESDTVAKDAGVDLSADAGLAFLDDIDGDIRSGTWDIGADEVVTGFDIPLQELLKSGSIYPRSNMIFTINGVDYKWDYNGLVNVSTGVKTHILRDNVMVFIG